jgi:hypothetical protein
MENMDSCFPVALVDGLCSDECSAMKRLRQLGNLVSMFDRECPKVILAWPSWEMIHIRWISVLLIRELWG